MANERYGRSPADFSELTRDIRMNARQIGKSAMFRNYIKAMHDMANKDLVHEIGLVVLSPSLYNVGVKEFGKEYMRANYVKSEMLPIRKPDGQD